jgi:hypothetical protein
MSDNIQAEAQPSCIPPVSFKRNEYGLICNDNVQYQFNPDGTVNWRKMIKPEFLVPNNQIFERTGRTVPASIEGLQDKELLILLGGLKDLASIRGFSKVSYSVSIAPKHVVAVCSIEWIPNYESEGRVITTSGIGDATPDNLNGFGKDFLGPFAENRAFVRCIRQFLKINIVSNEEINAMVADAQEDTATILLRDTATKYGMNFPFIKKKLVAENVPNAESFESYNDIPRFLRFELVERIKRKAAEKGITVD